MAKPAKSANLDKDKPRILVVDDDKQVVDALGVILEHAGYHVSAAHDGRSALRRLYDERPDLVLLDILMPDMDGYTVLERLREQTDLPVIMLTALAQIPNRVRGLDKGASDYITKPFANAELLARIRARLRDYTRQHPRKSLRVVDENLSVDFAARRLMVKGRQVNLTPTEWRLLHQLVDAQGRVVSFAELLRAGWENHDYRDHRSIKVQIAHLRRKIGDTPRASRYIHTMREAGYKFEPRGK